MKTVNAWREMLEPSDEREAAVSNRAGNRVYISNKSAKKNQARILED